MHKQSRAPDIEFRAGAIVGCAWAEAGLIDGRSVVKHSVRIEKRYRDDRSGEWKTTGYLRADDLPKLALVASKLFEQITLRTGLPVRSEGPGDAARGA